MNDLDDEEYKKKLDSAMLEMLSNFGIPLKYLLSESTIKSLDKDLKDKYNIK